MQPNRGSSSRLAKTNGQRSNIEERREAETTAETRSPQRKPSLARHHLGVRPLAAAFAAYSPPQSIKARHASPKKKSEQALALHMVLREPFNIEQNKRRQQDQWQKPLADVY